MSLALCSVGESHTITVSDDGVAYSFGKNTLGQLGFGNEYYCEIPSPIPDLPKIKMVSCGKNFTVCVDYEGLMWSFGENKIGQLGTGDTTSYRYPHKIEDVPPVHSISCGEGHTLIITNNASLWSVGRNKCWQLCLENKKNQTKPQQTSYSNISNISAGAFHSLFQNFDGEVFGCGLNECGNLGLGHYNRLQTIPCLIPNQPQNIIQFCCGVSHSLFLDIEGKVYSVGYNMNGALGIGNYKNQNLLNQIPNIPFIQNISCIGDNSFLIDDKGYLWSFGYNYWGTLGLGDSFKRNTPTKVNLLSEITQICNSSTGTHFLAKDSQNTIFASGNNYSGQMGMKLKDNLVKTPTKLNTDFKIWGDGFKSRAKSARK